LAALIVAATRVQLWVRAPAASEQLALAYMLAGQIAAASLLFPALLASLNSTILAIATAWPMAQLAAYLSDSNALQCLLGELYVSAWLAGLHLWARVLEKDWLKISGAAIAAMISIGSAALLYLRMEFGGATSGATLQPNAAFFGPISEVISQLSSNAPKIAWMFPAIAIIIGATLKILKWK
jgi:hypothetical protein